MILENFHRWGQYCEADPRAWVDLGFSCLWDIRDEKGNEVAYWISDFRNKAQVSPLNYQAERIEDFSDFDIYLKVNSRTCEDIFMMRSTAQEAFLSGELQIAGKMEKVLLLNLMFRLLKNTISI